MFKYSVILNNVGGCSDRFLQSGYTRGYTISELFERLGSIDDVEGTELISGSTISKEKSNEVKQLLEQYGLRASCIIPNHFGVAKWGKGAFTGPDAAIRKEAVDEVKEMVDIAVELGCDMINIWNGQDGHDYPMQLDYNKAVKWTIDGIKECAQYSASKGIRISLEYKPREPRTHSLIPNVYRALMIAEKTGCDNVGVTVDTGHSLEAIENIAEAACEAMREDKLFHMHFNDNYRHWDDDMISGSIHTIEYIELLYWLKKYDYTGWLSMDQYPYREDSVKAVTESLLWLKLFERKVESIDLERMQVILDAQDAVESTRYMREILFE